MKLKNPFLVMGILAFLLIVIFVFKSVPVFAAGADSAAPVKIGSLSNAEWKVNNTDYFGLNATDGELYVFDKTPDNETGLVRFTQNASFVGIKIPYLKMKIATKWYDCTLWNFTNSSLSYGYTETGDIKRANYSFVNTRLKCENQQDKDDFYYENFTGEVAMQNNGTQEIAFKYNITLWNNSNVLDRGMGWHYLSSDGYINFAKMTLNGTDKWINDTTTSQNIFEDKINLKDKNGKSLKRKWVWGDISTNQSDEKIKYKKFYWDGTRFDHSIVYFGYKWGSGSSWEIDPVLDYKFGSGAAMFGGRHIVFDKNFNDWVFVMDNSTGNTQVWTTCTDPTNNATCTARGTYGQSGTIVGAVVFQATNGTVYSQFRSVAGTVGNCYERTANGTWSNAGLGSIGAVTRLNPSVVVLPDNTFFAAAGLPLATGVDTFRSTNGCGSWTISDTQQINSSSIVQLDLDFISDNNTLVLVVFDSIGINYSYCTYKSTAGGQNLCQTPGSNWSVSTRVGNYTLNGVQSLDCAADKNVNCYWINQTSSPSTVVQGIFFPGNTSWSIKTIATVNSAADTGSGLLSVSIMPNGTYNDTLILWYINNTSATDENIRYATSNDAGTTWTFNNFNLTNNTIKDIQVASVEFLNSSNSSVAGFSSAVYSWQQENGSTYDVWSSALSASNIPTPNDAPAGPTNTIPTIFWMHANNTYNLSNGVAWLNFTLNFTDPNADSWVCTFGVNNTNTSFNNSCLNNTATNLSGNFSDGIYQLNVTVSDNSSSNTSLRLFITVNTDFDGDNFNSTFDCNNNNISTTPLNNNSITEINRSVVICPAAYVGATVTPITNTTGMTIDFNNTANLSGAATIAINFTSVENVTVVGIPNITGYKYAIYSKNANNNTVANTSLNAENVTLNGTVGRLILLNATKTSVDYFFEASTTTNELSTKEYVNIEARSTDLNQPISEANATLLNINGTTSFAIQTQSNGRTLYKITNVSDQNRTNTLQYNNYSASAEKPLAFNLKNQSLGINSSQTITLLLDTYTSPSLPSGGGGGAAGGGAPSGGINNSSYIPVAPPMCPPNKYHDAKEGLCCTDDNKNSVCDFKEEQNINVSFPEQKPEKSITDSARDVISNGTSLVILYGKKYWWFGAIILSIGLGGYYLTRKGGL